MIDARYPIGKFQPRERINEHDRIELIQQIAEAPEKLHLAITGLDEQQLAMPYREGGWSVKQVVHHLPDSHLNAYVRFKLALTENQPTIKTYHEDLWAELPDARDAPVGSSMTLLQSLHSRWVMLLRSLKAADFAREFNHPDHGLMNLDFLLQLYAWHGRHHVSQITSLRERMEWK